MTPEQVARRIGAPRVQAAILAALSRRGEEWLSGKDLSAKLFGDPLSGALKVHVHYMRTKWGRGVIESSWEGYRLGAVGHRLLSGAIGFDPTWMMDRFERVA